MIALDVIAALALLCLYSILGSLGDLISVMRRIAASLEAQNRHYGVGAAPTAEEETLHGPIR